MKNIRYNFITLIIVSILGNLNAHVGLDYPKGGQTFYVGDTVEIKWQNIIIHNPIDWDLFFSSDGGGSWQSIQLNLPTTQFTYKWIVPNILTNSAQIRIIQDNVGADYESQSSNFTIEERVLGISESAEAPTTLNLRSNFPNPFNPSTTIQYEISLTSQVDVTVYDMLGKKIILLDYGIKEAGIHTIGWHGIDNVGNPVSAGMYLYQIKAGQLAQTRKMLLLK